MQRNNDRALQETIGAASLVELNDGIRPVQVLLVWTDLVLSSSEGALPVRDASTLVSSVELKC